MTETKTTKSSVAKVRKERELYSDYLSIPSVVFKKVCQYMNNVNEESSVRNSKLGNCKFL